MIKFIKAILRLPAAKVAYYNAGAEAHHAITLSHTAGAASHKAAVEAHKQSEEASRQLASRVALEKQILRHSNPNYHPQHEAGQTKLLEQFEALGYTVVVNLSGAGVPPTITLVHKTGFSVECAAAQGRIIRKDPEVEANERREAAETNASLRAAAGDPLNAPQTHGAVPTEIFAEEDAAADEAYRTAIAFLKAFLEETKEGVYYPNADFMEAWQALERIMRRGRPRGEPFRKAWYAIQDTRSPLDEARSEVINFLASPADTPNA